MFYVSVIYFLCIIFFICIKGIVILFFRDLVKMDWRNLYELFILENIFKLLVVVVIIIL